MQGRNLLKYKRKGRKRKRVLECTDQKYSPLLSPFLFTFRTKQTPPSHCLEEGPGDNLIIVMETWKKRGQEPHDEHLNLFHHSPKVVSMSFGFRVILIGIWWSLVFGWLVLILIVDTINFTCSQYKRHVFRTKKEKHGSISTVFIFETAFPEFVIEVHKIAIE